MKRVVSLLMVFLLMFTLVGCDNDDKSEVEIPKKEKHSKAEKSDVQEENFEYGVSDSDSDYAYIRQKGELVIGITVFPPMNYYDENNNLVGFETEFAEAVCQKLGIKADFKIINWAEKEKNLNDKTIDCVWNALVITPERKKEMSLSVPYMANRQVLVVKSENAGITSVDGLKIVAEDLSEGAYVVENDAYFANAQMISVVDVSEALMEVAAGTADGCVVDYLTYLGLIDGESGYAANLVIAENAKFELGNDELYVIAFRKDSDMTEMVNKAIMELAADGTLMKIAEKYGLKENLLV